MATNPSAEGTTAQVSQSGTYSALKLKLGEVVLKLIPEIFATFVLLLAVGGAERFLHWWIGEYRFCGVLPVRWVFDSADLAIVLKFLVRTLRPKSAKSPV